MSKEKRKKKKKNKKKKGRMQKRKKGQKILSRTSVKGVQVLFTYSPTSSAHV